MSLEVYLTNENTTFFVDAYGIIHTIREDGSTSYPGNIKCIDELVVNCIAHDGEIDGEYNLWSSLEELATAVDCKLPHFMSNEGAIYHVLETGESNFPGMLNIHNDSVDHVKPDSILTVSTAGHIQGEVLASYKLWPSLAELAWKGASDPSRGPSI